MRAKSALIAGCVCLTAASCGSGSSAPSSAGGSSNPDVIRFSLNWTPLADHAAYYVAQVNNLYTKANLAVSILEGSGSGVTVRRIGTGQADCGLADTPVVINAIRNGGHLKIVAMEFDHTPDAIWTTKQSGITKPSDLQGKTVGAAPDDSERLLFPALAAANGFSPSTVNFVNIDPSAYYSALAANRVNAIFDFTTGAPFVEQAVGASNAVEIPWASNGLDLYGLAIVCGQDFLSQHGDAVKRFLTASFTGWQKAITDTPTALNDESQFAPAIDVPTYTANFKLALQLMCTQRYATHGMGYIDAAKMADTLKAVQQNIRADTNIADPTSIYTNTYLTHVSLPSCGSLS